MTQEQLQQYQTMAKLRMADSRQALEVMSVLEEKFLSLETVDTKGVQPLVNVLDGLHNVLREDAAVQLIPRDELLSLVDDGYVEDGYIVVPKTIE